MDNPSLLLAGLRVNKALLEHAPEEFEELHKVIEKVLESSGVEKPPDKEAVVALVDILSIRHPKGIVRNMISLDTALDGFFDTLFRFKENRPDISALCCAIALYRSRINPRP